MRLIWFLCSLLVLPLPAAAQTFFAGQLTPANIHRLPDGGLDAIGGVGDWLLTDGELCAVISGADHATYLALEGGSLVDLWHCGLANDQWSVAHTQLNLQKDQMPPTEEVVSGFSERDAWVETRGTREGLATTVRYVFSRQAPGRLTITTTISRVENGKALKMFGAMALHPRASLRPFSVDRVEPLKSRGFDQPEIDTTDTSSIMSSISSTDLQILLGSPHIQPTISYAMHLDGASRIDSRGKEKALTTFMIGGREFSMFGAFTQPFPGFWPRTPGAISFALGQLFDLDKGEQFVFRHSIELHNASEAAPFTNQVYDGTTVDGAIDTANASITVLGPGGEHLSFVRPDTNGQFSFRLPRDLEEFQLAIATPWGDYPVAGHTSDLSGLGAITTGAPAILDLEVDSPMSLVFSSTSAEPIFHNALVPLTIGGERLFGGPENLRLNLSGTDADLTQVQLPPGDYAVTASRGPEYGTYACAVSLAAGGRAKLTIRPLPRQVETPDMIGVDFHVHSGVSFDSSLPPRQRIVDFVARGGEVIVPTEHNTTYDLQREIRALGLQDQLHSFPGVELTGMARSESAPTTIGHSNVFPVQADAHAYMGGTLPFEGKRLGQVIGMYKARFPDSIFQLNHPRTAAFDDDITFFNHLSLGRAFDPTEPLNSANNQSLIEELPGSSYRDIDFDAIELLNGESMDIYELVRTDWFALLRQNLYKVATANSDSHVSAQIVAFPRSYVEVDNDDPGTVETAEIIDAVKRGAVYGTTGPIMRVNLEGAGPGETHSGGSGTLTVSVATADWVDASKVQVWINGELHETQPLDARGNMQIDLSVSRDSFVFVEVWGDASDLYRTVLPGFRPFAFANPIFIDVADNGWRYNED